jgi:hypothetical protein
MHLRERATATDDLRCGRCESPEVISVSGVVKAYMNIDARVKSFAY